MFDSHYAMSHDSHLSRRLGLLRRLWGRRRWGWLLVHVGCILVASGSVRPPNHPPWLAHRLPGKLEEVLQVH